MTDRTTLRRREVGVIGAAALSGLAGCAFGFGGSPTSIDVSVTNEDDQAHTVDVVVEFGEGTLLDERFVLDPGGQQAAAFSNPDEAGDATVSASLEGGGTAERELRAGRGSGLHSVTVAVTEEGTVEAWATVQ